MGIQRVKLGFWMATLACGGFLAWTVTSFVLHKQELMKGASAEEQQKLLDSVQKPPAPKDEVVDYDAVKKGFIAMNWTGKEAPKTPDGGPKGPQAVPKKPVSELLRVLAIQVDTTSVEGSLAYVAYVDKVLETAAKKQEDKILRVGETLAEPYANIAVDAITVDGLVFRFETKEGDQPREKETLKPVAFDGTFRVVQVGDGQVLVPAGPGQVTRVEGPLWNPAHTVQITANEYQVGHEDAEEFSKNYAEILSSDLKYRQYRNPKTKEVEGIEITDVRPGSLPASHGVTKGEILKSINGHKVSTVNEAIAFVKKNSDTTAEWTVVTERNGREVVRTYKSPPKD